MNEHEMSLKNKILEVRVGSFLYGTNTLTSDEDFIGVFIADEPYYLGLRTVNEVDHSIISKLKNGKNAVDAVDSKLYELRKFVKLAMECNPNISEILQVPEQHILFKNKYSKKLLDNRHLFPWKGLKQKFLGYAFSQKHKMMVKPENYDALITFKQEFENFVRIEDQKSLLCGVFDPSFEGVHYNKFTSIKFNKDFAAIGDLQFNLGTKIGKVYESVCTRLNKAGSRTEIFLKHGYDTKFGMHLVRLMFEGLEFLKEGELTFPLKERELLLDIRNGKYTVNQILELAEDLESQVEEAEKLSKLPSKPRYDEIEKLLINMVKEFHNENE